MAKNQKNVGTQENEVDAAMSKTEQFLQNTSNQKMLFGACAAVVIIVAAIWGWTKYSASQNAQAQDEIWESQLLFDNGQYEQALEGFEAVADQYGSTKAGNMAKAYAGLCQKNLGNYAEAISYLQDFSGKDDVVAPAILCALGDCYVSQDDNVKAAETFEKAAKAASNAQYTPLFLKKAGLAYEAAGNAAAAQKVYQSIKDNWAETAIAQSIDKYIERVK